MEDRHPHDISGILPAHEFALDPEMLGPMNRINWQKYVQPETSALIMIDMQNDALPPEGSPVYAFGATPMWRAVNGTDNVRKLVATARHYNMKVFWVRGGFNGVGKDIPRDSVQAEFVELLQAQFPGALSRDTWEYELTDDIKQFIEPTDVLVSKRFSSCFVGTDLQDVLTRFGIRNILLCGCFTDACVASAARSGSDLGYHPLVVADACAASSWDDQYHTCYHLSNIFATVTTTDEIIGVIERNGQHD